MWLAPQSSLEANSWLIALMLGKKIPLHRQFPDFGVQVLDEGVLIGCRLRQSRTNLEPTPCRAATAFTGSTSRMASLATLALNSLVKLLRPFPPAISGTPCAWKTS